MINHVPFMKMSGAGNDFIVIAARDMPNVDPGWLAERLCTRAMSLGGDGLIIVTPDDDASVKIEFFNPDGSRAEMCGNGARCAARYSVEQRLVSEREFVLVTDSGELPVRGTPHARFAVTMPEPDDLKLFDMEFEDDDLEFPVHSVWVGVPHCMIELDDANLLENERLVRIGRALRHHDRFPHGVNTNFMLRQKDDAIRIRTYERGVENLTLACGTGATAVTHILRSIEDSSISLPLRLYADGGELTIRFEDERYWLEGDSRIIATGILSPEAIEWHIPEDRNHDT